MNTHQVEVDDEVFALVKSHAEPLVDTFNTSLRRLLQLTAKPKKRSGTPTAIIASPVSFPSGTPQALQQVIEVALLVLNGAHTRHSATHAVAIRHRVAMQTVLDKYGRQLGLTANQFDQLLDQSDRKELINLLHSKFPKHSQVINSNLQ